MSPQTIVSLDRNSTVNTTGSAGYFASANAPGGGPYTLTASVPLRGDDQPGALTKNRLRAAGLDYPAEVCVLYLETPAGALGPSGAELLQRIRTEVVGPTPYDTASRMVDFLRNPTNFSYDTDMRNDQCEGLSTVECFAKVKRGFCQWYATTMAILLRELGIPARYVEGFLPGGRSNGVETVPYSSAHAWVEVYFPGYGWVEFDPTGGGVARDVPLPSGEIVPQATIDPNATFAPINEANPGDETGLEGGDGVFDPGVLGAGSGPSIFLVLLLAAGVLVVAIRITLRGPGGEIGPDQAWRGVTGLAARFGLGPRPAQTVFEYAGVLGEAMPAGRVELATVANAKVEVAYGRRVLGEERLQAVREAHRRLRVRLISLAIRGRLRGPGSGP